MTLRRRLTLLVALTIIVPITGVGVAVVNLVGDDAEARVFDRLRLSLAVARAALEDEQEDVARLGSVVAGDAQLPAALAQGPDAVAGILDRLLRAHDLDVVVVQDAAGAVLASARRPADLAPGIDDVDDEDLTGGGTGSAGRAVVVGAFPPPEAGAGTVMVNVGRWIDDRRIGGLPRVDDVHLLAVSGGRVVAGTGSLRELPDRRLDGAFTGRFDGLTRQAVGADDLTAGVRLVAVAAEPVDRDLGAFLLVFGAVLVVLSVLIVLVGYVVSGLVTGPVDALVDAALAVSRGDLGQRVDVSGDVELATLGRAFNRMTDNLREYVAQLEQSRNQFRAAIARLGDVLVSTHDVAGIIDVVLEACCLTVGAERAVFYERVALPARLRARVVHGGEPTDVRLDAEGLAGAAATALAPVAHPGPHPLAAGEPQVGAAMAVPVVVQNRLEGVIALYGRTGEGTFSADDLDTLQTLARQAEVALGNVRLHEETQRQARTDGTTGLANRREFEMRARETVAQASRFQDPFGVVLLDIDDFKQVNDRYDHSTGDAALIWVASLLDEATRTDVDLVARWGGEEFIVLLPRTGAGETATAAERMRSTIAARALRDGGREIPLTVSAGVACYPEDGSTVDELFKAADAALLRAKRAGKNRVERAPPKEGVRT
ncbi:MAG TPA: diguanylate cyclase [Acidimicrobiales bacterium]|nr:diguanylate cyclase [Acidimicrobiales bacterium]